MTLPIVLLEPHKCPAPPAVYTAQHPLQILELQGIGDAKEDDKMSRPLSELLSLNKRQLNDIRKEELVESLLSARTQDDAMHAVSTQLAALMKEIAELKSAITSPDGVVGTLNKKVSDLQNQVEKQAETISRQQRYLEGLDRKERENNIVLLGVPDHLESLDGATSDEAKVKKVLEMAGAGGSPRAVRRLGASSGGQRRRPMLVTLASRDERDTVLDKAKRLKTCEDPYKTIYIKKDVHPSVRAEWRRLREAEQREKERPENIGCNIQFNARERRLYKDGMVIDQWTLQAF